jgi:hypothetical protein
VDLPAGKTVNGQYYRKLLQDKVKLALCYKQPETPEHGVSLLQDNATHQCCDMQNLVQRQGWDVLAQAPYSSYLTPCD